MPASTTNQELNGNRTNGVALSSAPHTNEDPPRNPPGRVTVPPIPHISTNRILRHQRSLSKSSHPMSVSDTLTGRMRSISISGKTAPLKIDVLIVGGGLAGLACAYTLGQSGHRVRVLERSNGLCQRAGGVRVPPNLAKLLLQWGLGEELAKARPCRKTAFHSLETGEYLGFLEWQEDIIRESGGDFKLMAHDDVQSMLYDLAVSVGAKVIFNTPITSVAIDDIRERPYVTLVDGSIIEADVVLGADGSNSIVRDYVNGGKDNVEEIGQSFYTITIPSETLRSDPDLAKWADLPQWPVWMGDARSVLAYPIREGREFCVHLYWPDNEVQLDSPEGWDVVVPTSCIDLSKYDPAIQRLFTLAPDALRTKHMTRDIAEDWVDETGRIAIIGEAAHPLLPCSTHGASLAVEDAAVMGVLMSRLRTWEQVPQFMEGFQDIRQARCTHVRLSELHNAALVTLPPGEDQAMRDDAMRLSLHVDADWDDTRLRAQWEEIGEVFGYNALEAAEDWWIKWGSIGDSAKLISCHEPMGWAYAVTKVDVQVS